MLLLLLLELSTVVWRVNRVTLRTGAALSRIPPTGCEMERRSGTGCWRPFKSEQGLGDPNLEGALTTRGAETCCVTWWETIGAHGQRERTGRGVGSYVFFTRQPLSCLPRFSRQ